MHSMTGFGRGQASAGGAHVQCEIRSVNQKGLDVRIRGSGRHPWIDERARRAVQRRLVRGRIDVTLVVDDNSQSTAVRLDCARADTLRARLDAYCDARSIGGQLGRADIAALPGVWVIDEGGATSEAELGALVDDALDAALDALVAARAQEGAGLREILKRHVAACRAEVEAIAVQAAARPAEIAAQLRARVQGLIDDASVDAQRMATEIALLADKADVTEERDRLVVHLDTFDRLIDATEAVGRRMDFLCQELHREANTIGSKSSTAAIAGRVVELKAEIERLREQVQNVE